MTYHVVRDPRRVREVLRRVTDFTPANALTSVVPLWPATLRVLAGVGFALPPVLASATGERHLRVRRAVAAFFTPAKVAAVRPRVVALTRDRCRVAAVGLEHGPVDLAATVAQHVPPAIMQDLIGIACPDVSTLRRWSRDSLELFWGWPDPDRQLVLAESAAEFYTWLRATVRRPEPGSLFAALAGIGLSEKEICSLGYFLVIAGQETTAQLIDIACYRAVQDRATWRDVGTGGAGAFVQGILATEPSVHTWRRVTASDTDLAGTTLPAGAEILLQLAGQHPPDAAPTAYTLAFGHGLHRCLGAGLAELEAVTVLAETARALPDVTLTGPPPAWLRLLSFQAPLQVTVARRAG